MKLYLDTTRQCIVTEEGDLIENVRSINVTLTANNQSVAQLEIVGLGIICTVPQEQVDKAVEGLTALETELNSKGQ